LLKELKTPPDYLKKWLNKPVSGMSLVLCTVLESQLRMESLIAMLEPFRQKFAQLMKHREVKDDLDRIESDVRAGVYDSPAKLQNVLNALQNKIDSLNQSVTLYQDLLKNFENRLSSILYNYNSLDEAESILNKTINCLEVAERDAPKTNLGKNASFELSRDAHGGISLLQPSPKAQETSEIIEALIKKYSKPKNS
jgi:septal ring factor EnvC (AmiA/AmiB activator)